ncbi:hypothetical protein NEMBOFW57_003628 [Staphylotrichum longicolle]|uniref:Uncharacterized protein n=1 Tax=Staphylotrichum longicolle TaxID=669026 RepID=A0AAD4F642_9PEZI|nr:hypothetical protein NEMBOFW57_003628 [Staphylotrichum longicolle]
MPQNILLPQGFLPPTSMRLGRFLVAVDDPHLSPFHDPEYQVKADSDMFESTFLKYTGDQKIGSRNKFAAGLPSLLRFSAAKKTGRSCAVSADSATTYQLRDPVGRFKEAVKNEATRKWFEERKDDGCDDFYFVVGYHVMVNAIIDIGQDKSRNNSGGFNIPVSAALAASGIPLPIGGITDPEFDAEFEKSKEDTVRSKPVESVVVQQEPGQGHLSKENVWKSLLRVKGEAVEEEEDMAQVELEDEEEDEEGDKVVAEN